MVQTCLVMLLGHRVRDFILIAKHDFHKFVGSGKSSALTPHLDALGRALDQFDVHQEYVQYPEKNNELSFHQPFIISNVKIIRIKIDSRIFRCFRRRLSMFIEASFMAIVFCVRLSVTHCCRISVSSEINITIHVLLRTLICWSRCSMEQSTKTARHFPHRIVYQRVVVLRSLVPA